VAASWSTSTRKSADVLPAVLWRPGPDGSVRCDLCAHRCEIRPGQTGVCAVRRNDGGALVTLVGDRLAAAHVDPIEKKPFYHVLPGSRSFSLAAPGCNFRCDFCQNWSLSQAPRLTPCDLPGEPADADALVSAALQSGCATVAYTYTEPTVFFELAEAVGTRARAAGLKNLFVTNGYLTPETVARAAGFLDGANVDLKAFDDGTYRKVCGATLAGVLRGLDALLEAGVWVEVTTLLIPGVNDSPAEVEALARHLAGLSRDLPWHLSRFHPDFKRTGGRPTPAPTLERAREVGLAAGLRFVYVGNLPGNPSESTRCPECDTIVVERAGFQVLEDRLASGRCPRCDTAVAGIWT